MPFEFSWSRFLKDRGWTDERILGAQPDSAVLREWVMYQGDIDPNTLVLGGQEAARPT